MKTLYKSIVAVSIAAFFSACSVTGFNGLTDNSVGDSIGESSYNIWLGLIITNKGDASIKSAAENGGITKIATVDQKIRVGLFKRTYTTRVSGE